MKKRIRAFGYAFSGLRYFFSDGVHAKLMLVAAVLVVVAGWLLKITTPEWLTIIFCCGLVLALEAMNSALEYITDLVTKECHPLAKKAKDVAAASVLIASIAAAAAGLIIFTPKIILLLQ